MLSPRDEEHFVKDLKVMEVSVAVSIQLSELHKFSSHGNGLCPH